MPREGRRDSASLRSIAGCVELGAPHRGPFFSSAGGGPYSLALPTMRWKVTSIPAVAPQMKRPSHGMAQ